MKQESDQQGKTPDFGSVECFERFDKLCLQQTDLLEVARRQAHGKDSDGWVSFFALSHGVVETVRSIQLLARFRKVRDCFVLARCVLETAVNTALVIMDPAFANVMREHTAQKQFRDAQRNIDFFAKHFGRPRVELDANVDPALAAALQTYTGKKGQEITAWTAETVEARIRLIVNKYGAAVGGNLEVALFAVYRDASEVLHGTSFGVVKTITGPPRASSIDGPDMLVRISQDLLCELLFLTATVLSTVVQVAAKELGDAELGELARQLILRQREILERDRPPNDDDTATEPATND